MYVRARNELGAIYVGTPTPSVHDQPGDAGAPQQEWATESHEKSHNIRDSVLLGCQSSTGITRLRWVVSSVLLWGLEEGREE